MKSAAEIIRTTYIKQSYRKILENAGKEISYNGAMIFKKGNFLSGIRQKDELRAEIRKRAEIIAGDDPAGRTEWLASSLLKSASEDRLQANPVVDLSLNQEKMPAIRGIREFPTSLAMTADGPRFVKGVYPKDKTPVVYNALQGNAPMQSEISIYHDEFGRYATCISTERVRRPVRSKQVGNMGYEFASRIYEENQNPDGFGLRLLVARMTTSAELLEEILGGDPDPRIRFEAAANPHAPLLARQKGCPFCAHDMWSKPAETYDDLLIGMQSNPFRFAVHHEVHIAVEPLHNLGEPEEKHFIDFIRLAVRRAKAMVQGGDVDNVNFGMNYGTGRIEEGIETNSAFASFQHLHTQLTSIQKGAFNPGDEIADLIGSWPHRRMPFFEAYLGALEKDGLVIRHYDDRAFLVVPRAQMAKHQFRILTGPKVSNFLEMDEKTTLAVGEALHDATVVLRGMGIPSLNITSLSKRISDPRRGQPVIIDILPRHPIAFSELANMWVIDGTSEMTVTEARRILKRGNSSGRSEMRTTLSGGTFAEITGKYRPEQIMEDPLSAYLLYGNPNLDVRYWAGTDVLGLNVVLYGKDFGRFRNLPPDVVVQFGKNSWDSVKPGDPLPKIEATLNKLSNKTFALLTMNVLRIILDEKIAEKLKEEGNRIVMDHIIERVAKAAGKHGINEWRYLCTLSGSELKELVMAIAQGNGSKH